MHQLSKLTETFRNDLFSANDHLTTRAMLELSKTDHLFWKWKVYNMLLGFEEIRPEEIRSHTECRLGQWYFLEETREQFGHLDNYRQINQPHEEVHRLARLAVEACQAGDMETAAMHLADLEVASKQVIACLDGMIRPLA